MDDEMMFPEDYMEEYDWFLPVCIGGLAFIIMVIVAICCCCCKSSKGPKGSKVNPNVKDYK